MSNPTLQANFSANTAGFTQGVSVLRQKLTELNTQMEHNKQEIKTANTEIKNYRRELEQLKASTNNGAAATAEQSRRMQELRDGIATATARLGTLRTAEQDLRREINSTNGELRNQRTAVEEVQQSAATMGDVLKASLYSSAIQTAVGKLTSSLKSAAEYCYNVGSSFEAAMSQVEAISGATGEELDKLTEKAKQLGATTRFSATEAAQAMNYMAMAGWDAQQMLDGIDGVLSLAAASGGDLAETADIVTDAITAFGLKAEDVGHFSDVLAAASANANTNVSMMGETFKYCAPIAGALGFSIEDVSEAIGLMANSGIKSTMAGTALRMMFTKLSEGITVVGKNLGEVEIQTSNADGSMRSLKEILTDLRAAFEQLEPAERASQAQAIVGQNAYTGFLSLMNAGADDVDKLRTAIEGCTGASADMAETMTQNTAGAVTIMKSAMESLGIAVYEKFGEKIKGSVEGVTDIFTDLTERIESGDLDEVFERVAQSLGNAAEQLIRFTSESLPGFIEGVANVISFLVDFREEIGAVVTAYTTFKTLMAGQKIFTAAAGSVKALISMFKGLTVATEAQTTAQAANNAVMAANPFGVVAVAVAALVGGVVALTSAMDDCNERMVNLTDRSKELTQSSEDYQSKSKGLADVKVRYEQIKNSTDDAAIKEEELKTLQEELNSQFGTMAGSIDLVADSYQNVIDKMQGVIDKANEMSETDAKLAYYTELDAEKESTAISLDSIPYWQTGGETAIANAYFSEIARQAGASGYYSASGGNMYFSGSYDERLATLNDLKRKMTDKYAETGIGSFRDIADRLGAQITNLEDSKAQLEAATEAWNSYQKQFTPGAWMISEYGSKGTSGATPETDTPGSTATQPSPSPDGVDWNDFDSIKKYYKYKLDTEQIDEETYWNRLKYYGFSLLDVNTDEWRSLAAEIYKGEKAMNSSGGTSGSTKTPEELSEEEYTAQQKELKFNMDMGYISEEEYYSKLEQLRDKYLKSGSEKWRSATLDIHKYQLKSTEKTLDKIKDEYNAAVAAIDEEIKQRERDREDEDLQKQIDEVDKQLQYGRLDDFSKQQLQQKKDELLQEKEDIEWERGMEARKEGLDTVYTMARDAYEAGSADLEKALQTASLVFQAIGNGAEQSASTVNTVTNNNLSFALSAVSQTADQIAAAVVKAITSSI